MNRLYIALALTALVIMGACTQKNYNYNEKSTPNPNPNPADAPYVVMLSMDGFRWDYVDSVPTPNLDYIAENGVKAKSLKPSFPTFTFPNHYALATGLYPNNNGIVFNKFYDPELKKKYSIGNRKAVENPDFYKGKPIWVTAENQGMTTASFYWVGSETPICDCQPTFWKKYKHNFPFEKRIDSVVSWLQLPEARRPHLITWYMHEPDASGHRYGPHSKKTDKVVMEMDSLVGVFLTKVQALPIGKKVNIIILSDHGMSPVSDKRWTILKKHIPKRWVKRINGYNPTLSIVANEGYVDSIDMALAKIDHISYWKSTEVPERLHFGSNPIIGDFVVTADSSWSVDYNDLHPPRRGAHGYDNNIMDMHAIFYAIGPAFKEGYTKETFENVNIYPLIAKILKLKPAPVDGDLKNVEDILK
ncbi:MAG: ectonucleotide pyrophosphatase/phosphodiesterase [Hyphomicrobiales bacterium]